MDTLEGRLEDARRRHEAQEYGVTPWAVIEVGLRSVWAAEHSPSRPASPRPVTNEGGVDVGVNVGGGQVGSSAGGTLRQRGVIHADEVGGVQARGVQSSAAAGSLQGDVGGRRSGLSPMSATQVTAGGIAPSYGFFKFSPDRILVTPLLVGRQDILTWKEAIEPQLEMAGLINFARGSVVTTDDPDLRAEFRAVQLLTFMVISRCCSPDVQIALKWCREYLHAGHQAWHFIESTYQVTDDLFIAQLEGQLTHLRMGAVEQLQPPEAAVNGAGHKDNLTSYILHDEAMQEAERSQELLGQANFAALTKQGGRPGQRGQSGGGGSSGWKSTRRSRPRTAVEEDEVDVGSAGCAATPTTSPLSAPTAVTPMTTTPREAAGGLAVIVLVEEETSRARRSSRPRRRLRRRTVTPLQAARCGTTRRRRARWSASRSRPSQAGKQVLIPDVLYVPGVRANLLSSGQLKEHGVKLQEDGDGMLLVSAAGEVLGRATYSGRVLCTDLRPCPTRSTSPAPEVVALRAIVSKMKSTPDRMHARLAHVGLDTIQSSAKNEVAIGLDLESATGADSPCVSCVGGKLARHTFPDQGSDIDDVLAVVHIDLCGPFRVAAKDGRLYFLLLKDRKTRFVWVRPVAKKSDVLLEFQKWLVLVERQTKKSVLQLRSDRGGEFLGKKFTDFVDGQGIIHDLNCPYTQQQNGMAEREMRTVVESVRTMLLHMGVQHHWWHLALWQAVWVRNCLERSTLPFGTTPYQLLTGQRPDLSLARIWGCMALFLVPEQQSGGMLKPKARWGLHLGVSAASKGWELPDVDANWVVTTSDVVFYEAMSWAEWKSEHGPVPGRTPSTPPTDTSSATLPLLAEVGELAAEDVEDVSPPTPPSTAPAPPLLADLRGLTSVSASGDEGSSGPSPLAPTKGIAGGEHAAVQPTTEQSATEHSARKPTTGERSARKPTAVQQDDEGSEAGDAGESTKSDVVEVRPEPRKSDRVRRPPDFFVPAAFTTVYDVDDDDDLLYDNAEEDEEFLELDPDMLADPEHRWDISTMTVKEALASWKGPEGKAAMEEEIRSLINMGTWELVERPPGVNIMKNRWVLTTKYHVDDTDEREKARLVVKGFTQVYGADYDETFAPVGSYVTLRIFLSIAAVLNLNLMQLNMKNAFLQSKLDLVLYMSQPDYFNDGTGRVCKLLKSLYGLKQSPLLWYLALNDVLVGAGWKKIQVDEALYFKVGKDGVACWVLVYVDDLLAASSSTKMLKELLESAFQLREISPVQKYLGLEIVRDRSAGKLWLHQQGYADKLHRRFIDEGQTGRTPKTPVSIDAYAELTFDDEEAQERQEEVYRQKVGSLQFAATTTRPDVAFACRKLGSSLTVRSNQHWREVNRCLAYLANTRDTALEFSGGPESLELVGYVDADDAGDKQNRTSTGGYVFVYGGAAVSWSSQRIKCATLSSTESEYVAATEAGKEGSRLRLLLAEFQQLDAGKPTILRVDNKSAITVAEGMGLTGNLKHMERSPTCKIADLGGRRLQEVGPEVGANLVTPTSGSRLGWSADDCAGRRGAGRPRVTSTWTWSTRGVVALVRSNGGGRRLGRSTGTYRSTWSTWLPGVARFCRRVIHGQLEGSAAGGGKLEWSRWCGDQLVQDLLPTRLVLLSIPRTSASTSASRRSSLTSTHANSTMIATRAASATPSGTFATPSATSATPIAIAPTTLALLMPTPILPPTSSGCCTSYLGTEEAKSNSRGDGRGEEGRSTPLEERGARSTTRGSYSRGTGLSLQESQEWQKGGSTGCAAVAGRAAGAGTAIAARAAAARAVAVEAARAVAAAAAVARAAIAMAVVAAAARATIAVAKAAAPAMTAGAVAVAAAAAITTVAVAGASAAARAAVAVVEAIVAAKAAALVAIVAAAEIGAAAVVVVAQRERVRGTGAGGTGTGGADCGGARAGGAGVGGAGSGGAGAGGAVATASPPTGL
ncbi:unnamed protein product [Closterium sp. NIES-54]